MSSPASFYSLVFGTIQEKKRIKMWAVVEFVAIQIILSSVDMLGRRRWVWIKRHLRGWCWSQEEAYWQLQIIVVCRKPAEFSVYLSPQLPEKTYCKDCVLCCCPHRRELLPVVIAASPSLLTVAVLEGGRPVPGVLPICREAAKALGCRTQISVGFGH